MVVSRIVRLHSICQAALHASHFASMLALTMATNMVLACLGLLSGVLAARILGPVGRGELAAIQTWPTLFASLAMLGIPNALVYFTAREPEQAGRWLVTATDITIIACIPFATIGYWLMPWLLSAQRPEIVQAAQIYLLLLPLFTAIGMPQHPLRGRNDLLAWNLVRVLPNLVWVCILLLHILWHTSDPITLSQHYLCVLALLIAPVGLVVARRLPGIFRPSATMIKPLLRYGFPSVLSTLPTILNLRLDQMVMVGLLGPQILGLYVVGVAWSNAVAPLLTAVGAVLLPRVAGAQPEQQLTFLAQGTRLGMILSMLLTSATIIATPWIIPLLFGSAFVAAVPATMILCIAAGIAAYNQILTSGLLSLGKPVYVLIAQSAGLVVTMGLLLLLLPHWHLIGAALASLGSYLVISILLLLLVKKQTDLPIRMLILPTDADCNLVLNRWRSLRNALQK